jgi:hypothetical protein
MLEAMLYTYISRLVVDGMKSFLQERAYYDNEQKQKKTSFEI